MRVLSRSSLDTNVFRSLTKRSVESKVNFVEKFFQTKLLSRLSQKVCRLLSSPVLFRKFTIVLIFVGRKITRTVDGVL